MAFLRDFRHAIAVLKKQGLVPSDVDARSAYPSWIRGGRKLSTSVARFDPVVSGKATAVEVPERIKRKYQRLGRETFNERVIEPHGIDETAFYDPKSEAIIIKHKSGIERIQLPIEFHDLEQWARDVKKNKSQINALKSGRETFGFRYFGNNGSEFFSDIGLFIDFIRQYDSWANADTMRKGSNIYRNLEILRLNYTAMREWVTPSERKVERTREYSRKVSRRFRQRLKRKPQAVQEAYADAAMERQRKRRRKLSKAQRASENAKAKARMRKLRRK